MYCPELYYSKGRRVVGLLDYNIQREGRWLVQWVILFKGKEGGSFIVLYHSKGKKVVHSLGYTIQREGRWFIHCVILCIFKGKEGGWFIEL